MRIVRRDLARIWHAGPSGRSEIQTPWLEVRPRHQGVCLVRAAGGAEGTRTPDPHTASVVRYQLRHGPAVPITTGTRDILHIPRPLLRIGIPPRPRSP